MIKILDMHLHREPTDYFGAHVPDPDWEFIGADGTVYRWVNDKVVPPLATKEIEEFEECCECGEMHKVIDYITVDPADEEAQVIPGLVYKEHILVDNIIPCPTGTFEADEKINMNKTYSFEDCDLGKYKNLQGKFMIDTLYQCGEESEGSFVCIEQPTFAEETNV